MQNESVQFRDAEEIHHYGLSGSIIAIPEAAEYREDRARYANLHVLDKALAGFDEGTLVLVVERDEFIMRASLVVNI